LPTIADYTVIEDSAVTLTPSNPSHSYPAFDAPAVSAGAKSILVWRVSPASTPVTLELVLNGTSVYTATFQTTPQRTYHEIVGANLLLAANNILTIVGSGGGDVTVSDVYLSFQAIV
jgi:hypothetical protein